jgi:hypothetical protein
MAKYLELSADVIVDLSSFFENRIKLQEDQTKEIPKEKNQTLKENDEPKS